MFLMETCQVSLTACHMYTQFVRLIQQASSKFSCTVDLTGKIRSKAITFLLLIKCYLYIPIKNELGHPKARAQSNDSQKDLYFLMDSALIQT